LIKIKSPGYQWGYMRRGKWPACLIIPDSAALARGNKYFHDPTGEFTVGGDGCSPFWRSLGKPDQKHDQDYFLAAWQATEPVQYAGRIFIRSCIDHESVTKQRLNRAVVRQAACFPNSIGKQCGGKKSKPAVKVAGRCFIVLLARACRVEG